jgi:hypothetical protein
MTGPNTSLSLTVVVIVNCLSNIERQTIARPPGLSVGDASKDAPQAGMHISLLP